MSDVAWAVKAEGEAVIYIRTKCTHCDRKFGPNQTPFAFPLDDMRFNSNDRFCSEQCMHAAETAQLGWLAGQR